MFSSRKSGEGAAPSLLRSYLPCTLSLTTKIHYLLLIIFYNKNFLKKNYYMYFAKIVQIKQTLQFLKQIMHMMHICLFEY